MSISGPRLAAPAYAGPASPGLERFARESLGCQCPAEVFQRVEDERESLPRLPEIRRRIALGGRLLIYVAEPEGAAAQAPGEIRDRIADWVAAGRAERDRRGMNRLRLVVARDAWDTDAVRAMEAVFSQLPELVKCGPEEARIHLHCVPRSALADL
jgi:hypothetical protein